MAIVQFRFTAQFIGTPPMNILPMGEDKLGFRPERVQLGTQRLEGAPFARKGHILTREMLGSETTYKIQMGDEAIMVKSPDDTFQYDQDVVLSVRADDLYFFDKDGQRISYTSTQSGNTLTVCVGRLTASFRISLAALRQLRAEGIETIAFQTVLCSTTLSVDELLAMGGENAEAVLTHRFTDSSLTVG